jgi:ATP-dependent exoDNAse (exonuclease V) beta subunit
VDDALGAWRSMRGRADVSSVLSAGRRSYEVPFSLRANGPEGPCILRGTIDCLVLRDDGSIVVIEFKTGRRREQHQRQLDVYVDAARALFPAAAVEGMLIYPE